MLLKCFCQNLLNIDFIINIEWYSMGDMDADDYVSEIWIPVTLKKA